MSIPSLHAFVCPTAVVSKPDLAPVKNLSPVILGPAIELSGRHAKIRREDYRR